MTAVTLAPPLIDADLPRTTQLFITEIFRRVGDGPFKIRGYDADNLPDATLWADVTNSSNYYTSLIFVPNAAAGATVCFSDGTNWIDIFTGIAVTS